MVGLARGHSFPYSLAHGLASDNYFYSRVSCPHMGNQARLQLIIKRRMSRNLAVIFPLN